jgi:hypothetical protein
VRMSFECFGISAMVCRFPEEVQTWHHACSMTASIARSPIWRDDKRHIPSDGRRHWPPGTSISGNANTSIKEQIDVWKPFPLRWWALWRWLSPKTPNPISAAEPARIPQTRPRASLQTSPWAIWTHKQLNAAASSTQECCGRNSGTPVTSALARSAAPSHGL